MGVQDGRQAPFPRRKADLHPGNRGAGHFPRGGAGDFPHPLHPNRHPKAPCQENEYVFLTGNGPSRQFKTWFILYSPPGRCFTSIRDLVCVLLSRPSHKFKTWFVFYSNVGASCQSKTWFVFNSPRLGSRRGPFTRLNWSPNWLFYAVKGPREPGVKEIRGAGWGKGGAEKGCG
jgi:hypothetical protein